MAPAAVDHKFLHGNQKQGENGDDLMEMVKENVIDTVPGKGVQKPTDDSVVGIGHESFDISAAGDSCGGDFQHQERGHEIRHRFAGEQQCQPEPGASQQVEGIGADEVCAQVRVPVPADIAGEDGVVGHLVKGDLLDVKVAVIDKQALVPNQKREKKQEAGKQPQPKHHSVLPQSGLLIFIHKTSTPPGESPVII